MSRRDRGGRRITGGQVVALLTAARGNRVQAVDMLEEHLRSMRRRDVEDLAACLAAVLLSIDAGCRELAGVGVLEELGLNLAVWGWQDTPVTARLKDAP